MILYNSEAGRIKQRILCCRKFIVIFGSSDLFIEQLLALAAESAECRLLKFSFRAWQKYCILPLLSLGRFSEGILINISSKKNAFVRVFTLTILWLSAILKLDFLKSPGKSVSARLPRGMKLGNIALRLPSWHKLTILPWVSRCFNFSHDKTPNLMVFSEISFWNKMFLCSTKTGMFVNAENWNLYNAVSRRLRDSFAWHLSALCSSNATKWVKVRL